MRKKRRSTRRTAEDVLWTIVVGGLAIGAIVVCARHQGDIRGSGIRLALIVSAIGIGAGAGILADRLSASHRSSRSSGPNRKTRRHIRTVAFAITGMVVASCILAFYMAHHAAIIIGAALAVLAANWLWYIVESRLLSRGGPPGRIRQTKE